MSLAQGLSTARLLRVHEHLRAWLIMQAYPRWAADGIDARSGGFVETIERDGVVLPQPRRLRVQARQIYALAQAQHLGYPVDLGPAIRGGLKYLTTRYQRSDGLFRTLVGADGRALDDRALLYDQAFVLLAYAAAAEALGDCSHFEQRARLLRRQVEARMRGAEGAFYSAEEHPAHWESNPHMHLLEACLAWEAVGEDVEWRDWASGLMDLCCRRFVRADSGLVGESFSPDWGPASGIAGRILEPGHQFEWAWLLLKAMDHHGDSFKTRALHLINKTEHCGIYHGVAVNALLDDLSLHDAGARFWPQTERLKAALAAAPVAEGSAYTDIACRAAESLLGYLNPETPGLWFDERRPDGTVTPSSAPASTLYHVVGAMLELHRTLRHHT